MEDKEEKVSLRDQIAIAAMQALITHSGAAGSYLDDGNEIDSDNMPRTERVARLSYLIADKMRKARLTSFK